MNHKFFISRNYNGPYKFLITSSKSHIEKKINTNLLYHKYKRKKLINFKCIIFIFKNILNLSFFSKQEIMKIRYEKFNISRYAISRVFFNYYS